jgi:hypothetical protein
VSKRLAPDKALLRYALGYIAFARENSEDMLLVFSNMRSRRSGASEAPGAGSPYARLLAAAQAGLSSGAFAGTSSDAAEQIAYGLWATAHGLAMLQLTHLHGFDADFDAADQKTLEAFL